MGILLLQKERVLRCLAGGALVGILQPELLIQIRELGPAVNCGEAESSVSPFQQGNASSGSYPLNDLLEGFTSGS